MYTEIQGLFKEKWNSRTFQGLPLKFKDFSRLCEPCEPTFFKKTKQNKTRLWRVSDRIPSRVVLGVPPEFCALAKDSIKKKIYKQFPQIYA